MPTRERDDNNPLEQQDLITSSLIETYITSPQGRSQQFSEKLKIINDSLTLMWGFHAWARNHNQMITETYPQFQRDGDTVSGLTEDLHNSLWELNIPLPSNALDQLSILGVKPNSPTDSNSHHTRVQVASESDLHIVAVKIRDTIHDIRSDIGLLGSTIYDYTEHPLPKLRSEITYFYRSFAKKIESLSDKLSERYPKDLYKVTGLTRSALGHIAIRLGDNNIQVSSLDKEWEIYRKKVIWSSEWLEFLMTNIAQNAQRAYQSITERERKIIIRAEKVQAKRKIIAIDLIIDDNGPGFPDEIVANGFREGVTYWADPNIKGTGIGMAYHAKVLREHYGGDLIPEHRTDEAGNRIPGARLRVRLPVAKPDKET